MKTNLTPKQRINRFLLKHELLTLVRFLMRLNIVIPVDALDYENISGLVDRYVRHKSND
jgi:hypothetical protein